MIEPTDPELRDRLARLATAVPIKEPWSATPEVGRLVRGPIVWRGSGPSRLAVATVVVATLAVLVWGGVTGRFGPAGSGASSVVSDGTFELSLSASQSRYAASEPIVVKATLTYLGSDPSITVFHSEIGPVGFAIDEPVPLSGGGTVQLSAISRLMCTSSVLRPGVPLDVAFAKSGGNSAGSPPPSDDVVRAFFADPVLRLPAGTWHVVALAGLSLDGCYGERHQLQARITIVVDGNGVAIASPYASENTPGPRATPPPGAERVFPDVCPSLDVTLNECAGFAAWAVGQAGVAPGHVQRIEMTKTQCPGASPCPSGAVGTVVSVHIAADTGVSSDQLVNCTRMPGSLGGINLLCGTTTDGNGRALQYPFVVSPISGGYRDTPCSGEGPIGCATALPTIEPSALADSKPLSIGTRSIPIDHAGQYSVVLGQASLPNGILTAASADVTSSPVDPLVSYAGYQLVLKSLDGGPRFENYYAHGWRSGTERVEVSLEFTVLTFTPGAVVEVSNVDVH